MVLLGSQRRMGRRLAGWLFIGTFNASVPSEFEENSVILAQNYCKTLSCTVMINKMSRIDVKQS